VFPGTLLDVAGLDRGTFYYRQTLQSDDKKMF
jgi:hypothetical protein